MFEYFTFSAPALSTSQSSQGSISPTNTDYTEDATYSPILAEDAQTLSPSINELVMKLGSQNLDSSYFPDQDMARICTPKRTTFLPSPVDTEFSSVCHSYTDTDPFSYTFESPPCRENEMIHPNLFSSFHPHTAEEHPCRTQRQILQEQQCRSTFTRDLKQLLEGMIEKGDQCKFADKSYSMSSPPPSRGRERGFSASFMDKSGMFKNHDYNTHDGEGCCERDDSSACWSASAINSPSQYSTSAFPSTTLLHPPHSPPDSRKSSRSRHRRVASEGNIEIDFDTREIIANASGEVSLRRAGAPAGIVKMGRTTKGRVDANVRACTGWRKNVPKLRKPRREKLVRRIT